MGFETYEGMERGIVQKETMSKEEIKKSLADIVKTQI
jgi:hypothetical protein